MTPKQPLQKWCVTGDYDVASRRQIKAAREREKKAEERERDAKKVAANWERIKGMASGFERTDKSGSGILRASGFKREVTINEGLTKQPLLDRKAAIVIDEDRAEEMQEREAAAQEEKKRKAKRVAIVCHKSSYQYVTEGMDPKLFGRK